MDITKTVAELLAHRRRWDAPEPSATSPRIGFVPTMGALHQGHLALVKQAREECDRVVVSIFVNPKQFGPKEDFSRYPRSFDADCILLRAAKPDLVCTWEPADFYPPSFRTVISVPAMAQYLCGATRHGHFDGVCTVVARMLGLVRPTRMYLGKKDYQQLRILQTMATDLALPVEVVGCETVREPDGVAMSSRNRYLDAEEREAARVLNRALGAGREAIKQGSRSGQHVAAILRDAAAREPLFEVEYAAVVSADSLTPQDRIAGPTLLAMAGRIGTTRLIDNADLVVHDAVPAGGSAAARRTEEPHP
jgi:pantoate--beta-alanine ligase